jgi:transcription elongation factor Elf1
MAETVKLRDRYPITCPRCKHEWDAPPSEWMQCGNNEAVTRCTSCQAVLHLEIVPDLNGPEMRAEVLDDFFDRVQGKTGATATDAVA